MMMRAGDILMRARLTWWRFLPAAILVGIAASLAALHGVPVHLGVPPAMQRARFIRLLASRFTDDTGLPVTIDAVPAAAIEERIRRGDLDIVITHGNAAEGALDTAARRRAALSTMFVIVGPRSDPAHVWTAWSAVGALEKIAATHAPYQRSPATSVASDVEATLWRAADASIPEGPEPDTVEETLARAAAHGAYMIVDRPTFRRLGARTGLIALFEGDPALVDTYTVAELRHATTIMHRGRTFWHWFHSPKGEAAVRLAAVDGDRDYSLVH
jgi:tungstate transport system substrate-binding protein